MDFVIINLLEKPCHRFFPNGGSCSATEANGGAAFKWHYVGDAGPVQQGDDQVQTVPFTRPGPPNGGLVRDFFLKYQGNLGW